MISLKKGLSKEDVMEIARIKQQIDENVACFECPIAIRPTYPIRIGEDALKVRQQDGNKYYFFSEDDVLKGLSEMMKDEKIRKIIAENAYIFDEDEEFTEVYPTKEVLGLAKKGRKYVESNNLSILFKVLPFGKPDRVTGMPVHIESIKLVAE